MPNSFKRSIQHLPIIKYCFLLWAFILPNSAVGDVLILLSGNTKTYQQVAEAVKKEVSQPSHIATVESFNKNNVSGFSDIVTIGANATHHAYEYFPYDKRIFAGFLPRKTFNTIVENYPDKPRLQNSTITAVFLDQPLDRQIALAKTLKPAAKSLGTVLGPNSKDDLETLQQQAKDHQLKLSYTILKATDNPLNKIQPVISDSDIFLTLPDNSVFNRTSAKWILFISLRKGVPLIGFSKKYVSAGALAAVYSSPEQIGQELGNIVNLSSNKNKLPKPQYPEDFKVIINSHAADLLKLNPPSQEQVEELLKRSEK